MDGGSVDEPRDLVFSEYAHDTTAWRNCILECFDPDAIARDGDESVRRRELIARAMTITGTRWDHSPVFDATKQYVR